MRRLLAAGCAAAAVATAAACGDGNGNGDQARAADNTSQVCADAQQVQVEAQQQLQQELAQLEAEELGQEEFQQQAVGAARDALQGWSEGLREPADQADNPEVSDAMHRLADGIEEAAPQLTVESLQPGAELPNSGELDEAATRLTELCPGASPETP